MTRKIIGLVLVFALLTVGHSLATDDETGSESETEPVRLIVGFQDEVDAQDGAWLESQGAAVLRLVPNAPFAAVSVADPEGFEERVLENADVRYVEPDAPVHLETHHPWPFGDPIDTEWSRQWGPAAVNAPEAWATTMGNRDIIYAVVDTGVDTSHTDLMVNAWLNSDELPDGQDTDGNGYVDDTGGWNCAGNNNNPGDYSYHGTHVAGIAAAQTNNYIGIAGVAQAQIMPLRALGGPQGITSAASECIRYAADNGAHIIGMSWWAPDSQTIRDAITYAWDQGSLLTKSAGNQYGGGVTFPGYLDEVIATSALDSPDTLASFSSVGEDVEVTAPGANIWSTVPGGGIEGAYNSLGGTRMAQPHTAGVAALIWSVNPDLTNQDVRDILQQTAHDLGDPGRDPLFGYGRIDAEAAVAAAENW